MTARQRLELGMAQTFTGAPSMQAVLDVAVERYLEWMKGNVTGFAEAIQNAVAFQEKQAGVASLRARRD